MEKDLFKDLTEEQIKKVQQCKNHEELLELAKQEGVELTDEQLEVVSGGCGTTSEERYKTWGIDCKYCGAGKGCMKKITDSWYECKYCHKITIIDE